MKCDAIKKILPFLDDGSLPERAAYKVREHLDKCPSCLKEYHEIKNLVGLVKDSLRVSNLPADEEFLDSLHRRIDRKRENTRNYRMFFSAAAIFFMVIGASLFIRLYSVNDSNPIDYVKNGSLDFYKYVAENYLESHDFLELVDVTYVNDTSIIDVSDNPYVEVTFDDIVINMDENEIPNYFIDER